MDFFSRSTENLKTPLVNDGVSCDSQADVMFVRIVSYLYFIFRQTLSLKFENLTNQMWFAQAQTKLSSGNDEM